MDERTAVTDWARRIARLLSVPLLFCAVSARPAEGETRILTPGGLGPVRLGMTVEDAEQALGAPLRNRAQDEPPGCWITRRADGREPGVAYMVVHGQIRRIDLLPASNTQPLVRSAAGVGVGSSEMAVRRAYGAKLTVAPHKYTGADGGHYLILAGPGGQAGLVFETFNGTVTQVRAGLRPELDYVEGCS